MIKYLVLGLACTALLSCKNNNSGGKTIGSDYKVKDVKVDMDSESQKFSYALGTNIAQGLKAQGEDSISYGVLVDALKASDSDQKAMLIATNIAQGLSQSGVSMDVVNYDVLVKAANQVFQEDSLLLTDMETNMALQTYVSNAQQKWADKNFEAEKAFLEKNKESGDITVTDSGLQYQLIEEGTGKKPGEKDYVLVHYTGTTIDGEEFDSSRGGEPVINRAQGWIRGFNEGLAMSTEGSKYRIFIPGSLAYGMNPPQGSKFGPNACLIFDVELIKVMNEKETQEYIQELNEKMGAPAPKQ